MPSFSVVRAFAYGPRGRRHAVVLSTHATAAEAFAALDRLAREPGAPAPVDCYVVDEARDPVPRPAAPPSSEGPARTGD